jgi:hypothetical protein
MCTARNSRLGKHDTRTSRRGSRARVGSRLVWLARLVVALSTVRFARTDRQRASAGPQSRAATPPSAHAAQTHQIAVAELQCRHRFAERKLKPVARIRAPKHADRCDCASKSANVGALPPRTRAHRRALPRAGRCTTQCRRRWRSAQSGSSAARAPPTPGRCRRTAAAPKRQLGRERVARHAHHSPGRADLLLHRCEQVGLELDSRARAARRPHAACAAARVQQVATVVAAAAACQHLGGVASAVARQGAAGRVWARHCARNAQQSANSSLSARKSLTLVPQPRVEHVADLGARARHDRVALRAAEARVERRQHVEAAQRLAEAVDETVEERARRLERAERVQSGRDKGRVDASRQRQQALFEERAHTAALNQRLAAGRTRDGEAQLGQLATRPTAESA